MRTDAPADEERLELLAREIGFRLHGPLEIYEWREVMTELAEGTLDVSRLREKVRAQGAMAVVVAGDPEHVELEVVEILPTSLRD